MMMVDTKVSVSTLPASIHKLLLGIGGSGDVLTRQLPDDADCARRPSSWLDVLTGVLGLVGAASIASSSSTLQRGINGTELLTYNMTM